MEKLRFKDKEGNYYPNWKTSLFSDTYEKAKEGGTPSTSKQQYYQNGNIPFVKIEDLKNKYIYQVTTSINQMGLKNSSAWIVPIDSVLLSNGATIGETSINKIEVTTKQGILGIVPKIYNEFLYYLVSSSNFRRDLKKITTKGTMDAAYAKDIAHISVNIPVIQEQEKIASFLSSFDNLIQKQQEKIGLLKELKRGYLQQMFPEKGANVPQIRFKGFTDAWEQCELSELATFSKGSGYSKGDLVDNGSPIILYGRLYTKYETTISDVDTYVLQKPGSVISAGGEVIVPASGETAKDIAIASVVEKPGIILGGDLNVIHPKEMIESTFLALSITYGLPHIDMAKRAQGKSVVHLHNSDLQKVLLNFPKKEEQLKISQYLMKLDSLITLHLKKLDNLEILKKGYMQKLFA